MSAQTPPWGASPADWHHFADTLGLREDLLPVVSDPGVKPRPLSAEERKRGVKPKDFRKVPSRINREGFAAGFAAWPKHTASERDIQRWSSDPRLGICINTRHVRAIDIDVPDPALAEPIRRAVLSALPGGVVRFRPGTGKCLLPVIVPGDFGKRSFALPAGGGRVELLATGQQFVAVATHPDGSRYQWCDADGVVGLPAALPTLDVAALDALWDSLVAAFAERGSETRLGQSVAINKPRVLTDTNDPAVAWLYEHGWVRGETTKGLEVECPNAHNHSSDTGWAMYFPAGVGGRNEPGYKCMHDHCTHINGRLFLQLVGYDKPEDDFPLVVAEGGAAGGGSGGSDGGSAPQDLRLPALRRDRGGRIEPELNNLLAVLPHEAATGVRVARDEFFGSPMLAERGGSQWRRMEDVDYTALRSRLERLGFKALSKDLVRDAVHLHAHSRAFDSARDWAARLQWDGVPRCEAFLTRYCGVPDTPYHRAVSIYIWTALAGRCLSPGVKADMVPVFVGPQGCGKTTAVQALAPTPEAFIELDLSRKEDDLSRLICGRLVGEIAELRGLRGREAEAIKAFVTRTHETWIEKWATTPTRFARRLVMFGTTNDPEFLDDETGNRRWLPVSVGEDGPIDVAGIVADRDQLWAEGCALFAVDGVLWQDAQRLAVGVHDDYKVGDVWEPRIEAWLAEKAGDEGEARGDGLFTMADLLRGALGLSVAQMRRADGQRAAKVLTRLGFERVREYRDGRQIRVWRRAK